MVGGKTIRTWQRGKWVWYPLSVFSTILLGMASVEADGRLRYTMVNDGEGCLGGILQRNCQGLLFQRGEGGQHPVRQFKVGMGLGTYTDLHPGELLGADFLDDGLDAVMTAGRAVGPYTEPSGFQRNVIKQDNNPLGRDVEISGKLESGDAGAVHIGQGLQEKYLFMIIGSLSV